MGIEVERKFLVSNFPQESKQIECGNSEQFYIFNEQDLIEHRARKLCISGVEKYLFTIKTKGNLSRVECEFEIKEKDYADLKRHSSGDPLYKEYRAYRLKDGKKAEVAKVDNTFIYLEVEFKSVDEAESWVIPEELASILIKEITYDKYYKMHNYWLREHNKQE